MVDREELVLAHLPLARRLAVKAHHGGSAPLDDLEQDARLGLLDAAARWNPAAGEFIPFAVVRIRGAIVDGQRRAGWWRRAVDPPHLDHLDAHPQDLPDPGDPLAHVDDADQVRRLLAGLRGRQFELIHRHYWGGETLRAIGASWGVTESRACQIHRAALRRIRPDPHRNSIGRR